MKILKLSVLLLPVLLFSTQIAAKNFVDGELLVKFKTSVISAEARTANEMLGAEVLESFPELGWMRVKLPDGMSRAVAENYYKKLDSVAHVQPNFYYSLQATPNDTLFPDAGMYGLLKISAPQAWDIVTGNPAVVVANIDTGMRMTHEDLAANIWVNPGEVAANGIDDDNNGYVDDVNGYDFYSNDADPSDIHGHGTHTGGTIGARGNNGLGVTGVNWNVKIMPIKIYSASGGDTTSTMLINAYNYVRIMKQRGVNIRITNNSYGGCAEACGYDQATKDAIDSIEQNDILQVFAAGNSGQNIDNTPFYPASYNSPSILSVAASNSSDNRQFSYGVNSVDLAAPGVAILSTTNTNNTSYNTMSGTSMATPHVSGAAALLAAHNANLSAASLKASLMNNVDVLANWNGFVKTGGRLNVFKAIQTPTVCVFSLSTNGVNIGSSASSSSVSITTATNCDYSVRSNAPWITVTAGDPGSGNGTVNYSVQANTGAGRTGTISIGYRNYTIFQAGSLVPPMDTILDFDADGKTDYVTLQNIGGAMRWHLWRSQSGYTALDFGLYADDIAVPMDYDGDGRTDVAVWRGGAPGSQGYFYFIRSTNNSVGITAWGSSGDDPTLVQDFDGDGKADFTVVRKLNGYTVWYVMGSSAGLIIHQFGYDTDIAIRGDFDGDHKADPSIYRPASGSPANTFFSYLSTTNNLRATTFGLSAVDKIIPADFDGDNKTDIAVWRNSDGNWYYLRSTDGVYTAFNYGTPGNDLPAPGDFDGDGRTDFGIWRPNTQTGQSVFSFTTQNGSSSTYSWGTTDMRVPGNSLQVKN